MRKSSLAAGIFYLLTFLSSIPAALLITPVLTNANFIIESEDTSRVLLGCFLDIVNAIACIGTAIALFPVVKKKSESFALGFVASRIMEAAIIMMGVISLLTILTLRDSYSGDSLTDKSSLLVIGNLLVEFRNWTFLIGPGLVPAFNALLLGYLIYSSRLVPRFIPLMGLVGAPLLLLSALLTFFGANEQGSTLSAVLTLPLAGWELTLGLWLTFKGFRSENNLTTKSNF